MALKRALQIRKASQGYLYEISDINGLSDFSLNGLGGRNMGRWENLSYLSSRRDFKCGFCGTFVGPDKGYVSKFLRGTGDVSQQIAICPSCNRPTYFEGNLQFPTPAFGNDVAKVPREISLLYNEARACTGVQAYTAAVLCCRKLLMNVAVKQGALEGKPFIEYVEYLSDKGYVPPNGKHWVDHIRKKGNEATHEIALMKKEDAEDLISFTEMLLKFIFEFPSKLKTE